MLIKSNYCIMFQFIRVKNSKVIVADPGTGVEKVPIMGLVLK